MKVARTWLPVSVILKGKKKVLKEEKKTQPQINTAALYRKTISGSSELGVDFFFFGCFLTRGGSISRGFILVSAPAALSGLRSRQTCGRAAGPSLTPHTKAQQDVVVQILSRRLLQTLSSLTFPAEPIPPARARVGAREEKTASWRSEQQLFRRCLKRETCLAYAWFFCKNKLM